MDKWNSYAMSNSVMLIRMIDIKRVDHHVVGNIIKGS